MADQQLNIRVAELIQRAHRGDQSAFAAFYNEFLTPVYRFILVRVKNKHEAEDLTQAVFSKAYENLAAMSKSDSRPLAYLYTIARNSVIDYYKKKKEVMASDTEELFLSAEDEGRSAALSVDDTLLRRKLEKAITTLTPEQQEVVSLRFFNDYSTFEIAELLDKSQEAVRQLQSRALKAMRPHLS